MTISLKCFKLPTLKICRSVIDKVIEESRSSNIEKVYIGIGILENNCYVVKEVFECKNMAENPRIRFVADPFCIYNAYVKAEAVNMKINLLIHSHPAPPVPSMLDYNGMRASRFPWLIVDMNTGEYAAWIMIERDLVEVHIDVLDC